MTADRARLKDLITSYWQLDADGLTWDTELNSRGLRNFSSLRALRFFASVEADFDVNIEDPDLIRSFRDLLHLVEK
jgi:acyl carrier protein